MLPAIMRYVIALACCVSLTAADLSQLRQLEEKHRMFELRALLEQPGMKAADTLLYRAMTASRFGQEREALVQFGAFLATKPAPEVERRVRFEMSAALMRLGEYGQAASELSAALRLGSGEHADSGDSENARVLLEALKDVAKQTVEFGPPAPIEARRSKAGIWEVPVDINSQRGQWILDTGANFSTVTESEARRMGLAVREAKAYARGLGTKLPTRLAVAGEVRFGPARIRNVVFLVMPDQTFSKYQIQGILGLPVIRALECIDLSAEGTLTIDRAAKPPQGVPNLFFHGLNPIAQVAHSGHSLQMMLDTGAVATFLYPSVRETLAQWERHQLTSATGQIEADFVPSIQLDVLGRAVYLQRINLLKKEPAGNSGLDGILGADALGSGFRLDFRAMRFMLK